MRQSGRIVLVSCYELGHPPLAVASAAAFLERAGFHPTCVDLSQPDGERELQRVLTADVRLLAFSTPMHTALTVATRARARSGRVGHVCFYGLYAALNGDHLLQELADSVVGGECESVLVELAQALDEGRSPTEVTGLRLPNRPAAPVLERLDIPAPSRTGLPGPEHYARLEYQGATRLAAAVEASRGCLHLCRHCPIPPVYGGRFFVVPQQQVLQDVRHLVADGVRHITFADPDFLNGPRHALDIVRAMHREFPELTFDITTRIEHLLKHDRHLAELAACGCLFVVSAVESLSDVVLDHLDKGHTRADVFRALQRLRDVGIVLRPSFVAFTPWTTRADYLDVLDWIENESLVDHVDPVQLSIRLLVPPGSLLARLPAMVAHLGALQPERFVHPWRHPDPEMDRLWRDVSEIVARGARDDEDPALTFRRIRLAARFPRPTGNTSDEAAKLPDFVMPARARSRGPRLTEPWFC